MDDDDRTDSITTNSQLLQDIKVEVLSRHKSYRGSIFEVHVLKVIDSVIQEIELHRFIAEKETGFLELLQQELFDEIHQMNASISGALVIKRIAEILRVFFTEKGYEITKKRKETLELLRQSDSSTSTKARLGPKEMHSINTSYLRDLQSFHAKYTDVIAQYFNNHAAYQRSIQGAFTTFLNDSNLENNAEIFCNFCHSALKIDDTLEMGLLVDELNCVFQLLTYVSDKDLFRDLYQTRLAHRLLSKTPGHEMERVVISNLKMRFGGSFTLKMEVMLSDIALANSHQTLFEEYLKNRETIDHQHPDFSVQVLSTGSWPSFLVCNVALPPAMSQLSQVSF